MSKIFKKSKHDKVVRILHIIKTRLNGRFVSPNDFSKKFGVSLRTIQRDFKLIREVLGDIFFEKSLNTKNKALKMLALGFIELLSNKSVLGLKDNEKNSLKIITIAPRYRGKMNFLYMDKIAEAFELSRYVKIRYKSPTKDESYEDEVIPIGVIYFDGYLYFVAKKSNDKDPRTFRFDRIVSLEVLDKNIILTEDEINEVLKNCRYSIWSVRSDEPTIYVELETYEWAKEFFENFEVLAEQKIIKKDKGLIVSGKVSNYNEVIPYILRFMPNVKVLQPQDLKSIIKDYLEMALKLYER